MWRRRAKTLGLDTERGIELAREILKRNQPGQLDDGVIVEMTPQSREVLRRGLAIRKGDRFRVRQRRLLPFVEKTARLKSIQLGEPGGIIPALQHQRRINVDTEVAPVDL